MLVAFAVAALVPFLSPGVRQTKTTDTVLMTTPPTIVAPKGARRIKANAGDRVRIALRNPDSRPWRALRPLARSVVLLPPVRAKKGISAFEYATSAATRTTLEFRHPSGARREVRLTVLATEPERIAPPAAVLTDAEPDEQLLVNRGEVFEVRLSASPSTGYSWRVEPLPKGLVALKSSAYVKDPTPPTIPPIVGAGGTQVFRFAATGRGRGDVNLVYERPFARGEDVKRFHFVLVVR